MFIPIPNFPDYQFNNETLEVKSLSRKSKRRNGGSIILKERILNPKIGKDGYYHYTLCNKNIKLRLSRARICWLTNAGFLPSFQKGFVIDHIDEDRTNDHYINLQILTNGENIHKSYLKK